MTSTDYIRQRKWIMQQFLFEEALRLLELHCNTLGVDWMPVKGAFLITTGLASKMSVRHMGDIDIVVRPADLDRVTRYFFELDIVRPLTHYSQNARGTESSCLLRVDGREVLVEFQASLTFDYRFLLPVNELFLHGTKRCRYKYVPAIEDAIALLLLHLYTHFPFEFREEQFYNEFCCLVESQQAVNWNYFWKRVKQSGAGGFVVMILYYIAMRHDFHTTGLPLRPYAFWQAKILSIFGYQKLPSWYIRIFIDLMFMRDKIRALRSLKNK